MIHTPDSEYRCMLVSHGSVMLPRWMLVPEYWIVEGDSHNLAWRLPGRKLGTRKSFSFFAFALLYSIRVFDLSLGSELIAHALGFTGLQRS